MAEGEPEQKAKAKKKAASAEGLSWSHCAPCGLKWKNPDPPGGVCTLCRASVADGRVAGSQQAYASPKKAAAAPASPKKAAASSSAPAPATSAISDADAHQFLDFARDYNWDDVKRLVNSKPDIVGVQPRQRWSALHQAAASGDEAMC